MSHGKETPRQKMINLMYLVLTLMLTLTISTDILKRFLILNVSIESGSSKILDTHKNLVEYAKKKVGDMGNRKSDVDIMNKIVEIYEREYDVVEVINRYKQEMIDKSGGLDQNGNIKDLNNSHVVDTIFIKQGGATELQEVINGGIAKFRDLTQVELEDIALDACNDPIYRDDPNERDKSFALVNFENTPIIVAMAVLSRYQLDFVLLSDKLISELVKYIGADMFSFDDMDMIVNAESGVLPLGVNYRALVLPVVKPKNNDMIEIKVNDVVVPFKDGFVNIDVKSPKNVTFDDKGVYTQKINVVATVKKGDKKGTQFKKVIECKRVKPFIETKTISVNKVYRDCKNNVMIKVSNIGLNSVIDYVGDRCNLTKTKKDGVFNLTTNKGGKCSVRVYCDSIYAGDCNFEVQDVPKPTVDFTINGKIIDKKKTISIDSLRRIGVYIKPDDLFSSLLPGDARYHVTNWKVLFCKDNKSLFEKMATEDEVLITANDKRIIKEGGCNRFVVEVKGINRVNYENKLFAVMDKDGSISNNFSLSDV